MIFGWPALCPWTTIVWFSNTNTLERKLTLTTVVSFRLVTDAQISPCCSAPIRLLSRRVDSITPHLCASNAELFSAAEDHASLAATLRQSRGWPGKKITKQQEPATETKKRKAHHICWLAQL